MYDSLLSLFTSWLYFIYCILSCLSKKTTLFGGGSHAKGDESATSPDVDGRHIAQRARCIISSLAEAGGV